MTRRAVHIALVVLLALDAVTSPAAVRRVPEDQPTVAQALASSASGDTVLLAPGSYAETFALPAGVTLRCADPLVPPVIESAGSGPVVTSVLGTGSSRLGGLVLRGGGGSAGGGVRVQGGLLSLLGVRIEDCSSTFGGGLALSNDAKVSWSGGAITGCSAAYGGAVFASGGTLTLTDLSLSGNTAQA